MCGLVSIFSYHDSAPPVDREELLRIRDAMIHRGPDGSGQWVSDDGRIGLAHRRLAILDLSNAAAQPMATADEALRIVYNGEIYNFHELRRDLESRGYRFRSGSDTEVLLCLYQEYGRECVRKLRGMFAFVIWDRRRQGIFLARDPFGIKPLYYADSGGIVRIASQVKALLKGGAIDTAIEPAGHVGFFLWGHLPEPYTLYKGIRALGAGMCMWIDTAGNKEAWKFFDITEELEKAGESGPESSSSEIQERLRHALLDSIRHHLVADVPVGVFLSAGLDSTTIAALTKEVQATMKESPHPVLDEAALSMGVTGSEALQTITLGFREFKDTPFDEVPIAERFARHLETRHQTRWISRSDFQLARQHLLDAMDQPSVDGVNSYFVCKAAAESGLKVALSGLGGDELFGGYPSFRQIPKSVGLFGMLQTSPLVGKGFRLVSAPFLKHFTSSKYAGLLEYGGTYGGAYLLRRGMFMPWELPSLLDAEIVRKGWAELNMMDRLRQTTQGLSDPHLRVSALETAWYMRNQLLRDADWASMAHSLELRVPLVDIELFRHVAALLKLKHPPNKRAMVAAVKPPLPDEIVQREKTGFSIPVTEWMAEGQGAARENRSLKGWARFVYREQAGGASRPVGIIYRTGQLGDTLIALPAIAAIREKFPHHRLILLTDRQAGKAGYVSSWNVLGATGFIDEAIYYDPNGVGLERLGVSFSMLRALKKLKPDFLISLAPNRSKWQALRDWIFFWALSGAKNYVSDAPTSPPAKQADGRLPRLERESDRLLRIVDPAAFVMPDLGAFVSEAARDSMHSKARMQGLALDGKLLAIGPGSKMSAKIWPVERYAEWGRRLLQEFPDLRMVVLGGKEDCEVGAALCRIWGEGACNLAGELSIPESAAMLENCMAYVGNDTGTMHLAAMSGIPCVALFSARDYPGKWEPAGHGHRILRKDVECAGCMLQVCAHDNKCLKMITVEETLAATRAMLREIGDDCQNPALP